MKEVLNKDQIDHFIHKGFIRIDNAFDARLAEEARRILWKDMDCDPNDPATWIKPVIWLGMYSQPPFVEAANTPVLHAAYDQLAGAGNWWPCKSMGAFPVRFPSKEDTGDTGWHVDASFSGNDPASEWRINWRSKGRAFRPCRPPTPTDTSGQMVQSSCHPGCSSTYSCHPGPRPTLTTGDCR